MLGNLLDNALKYSPPDTPIHVAVSAADRTVQIAVRDEGMGIPEADQQHIFDRFHRAANVDRNIAGLGLGLYIASEIARAHGGTLDVASTPEETRFTFRLPAG